MFIRRFLYYLDSKLGCDHINFIPMYEEDTIPQKELLDQFKADVKDKMTDAYVDDNGVLSPSDELPRLITICKGKDYNKLPNNFTKSEDIAQAWCNMINGITENVPALDSLPFDIEGKYSKNKKDIIDNYINQDTNATIEEDEAAQKPEDTGSFDNMPHFKVRKKKAAKDNDIDNLILSDEDMKDFARNLADNINKSRTNKDTTKHILSSILRKY